MSRRRRSLISRWWCLALLVLAACSATDPPRSTGAYKLGQPYQIAGRWYVPSFDPAYDRTGTASWYGPGFHGRRTANGEVFDQTRLSAAHPTLPLPSIVRVTNLANRRSLDLRVNDRGPFIGDRLIDLSKAAARELGFERTGTAPVRVQFVRLADDAAGTPPAPVGAPQVRNQVVSASSPSSCPAGRFIQVAAFAEPERAARLVHELSALKVGPIRQEPPDHDPLARVRVGPLASDGEIRAALDRLAAIGHAHAFLVDHRDQAGTWSTC